jgi:hypothetical protein
VPALVCLLLEHQSQEDPCMPLRTLLYAVLYWDREWKAWEERRERGAPLRLSPVLPIVFHTGAAPWSAPRAFADHFDVPEPFRSHVLPWRPVFWDLPAQPLAALRQAHGEWLRTMAVVRAERESAADFHAVLEEAFRRLAPLSETDKVRWHDLLWFLLSWSVRRRPSRERPELVALAAGSHDNVAARREVEVMTQAVEQTWEQEMLARGEARGELRGELRALRQALRGLLERRFGPLSEALLQRIDQADDVNRLRASVLQVLQMTTLDELAL